MSNLISLGKNAGKKVAEANKTTKKLRWLTWVARVATNKGMPTCLNTCAYSQEHIVGAVKKVGNAFVFKSLQCSGCPVPCIIIEEGFLVTEKSIKSGDTIKLSKYSAPNISVRINNTLTAQLNEILKHI
jgi:hypothetical protein